MSKNKRVVFTGGGTAGHVMLNLTLYPFANDSGFETHYIGSKSVEFDLVGRHSNLKFHKIQVGKLRRYFSFENLFDFFKVGIGFLQCLFILLKLRPVVVFSKGGYVSVPVCLASWVLKIPVVCHESDLSPGLATKINSRFAKLIMTTFPETSKKFHSDKSVCVGSPLRESLKGGDKNRALKMCGFEKLDDKPFLLIMGGSMGAQKINEAIQDCIDSLLLKFQVAHLTGKGKKVFNKDPDGYKSFEFVDDELKDLFAASDLVLSRAGSNAIFELLNLKKAMLLVPLKAGSRGDQIENAENFKAKGWAEMFDEDDLNGVNLLKSLEQVIANRKGYIDAMSSAPKPLGTKEIWEKIIQVAQG